MLQPEFSLEKVATSAGDFKMSGTLMMVYGDGTGDFVNWLKQLGVKDDFLREYPIAKLVEWGWLRPQYRIIFPTFYFADGGPDTEELRNELVCHGPAISELWESQWRCEGEEIPMWFIHPFFTPQSRAGKLLTQNSAQTGLPEVPPSFERPCGSVVSPYADYYYSWQAYALIDVIRASDIFRHHILDTPDAQARAKSLVTLIKTTSWNPQTILDSEIGWGGLAEIMTWLAHYAALQEAMKRRELHDGNSPGMLRRGAQALAAHLGVDPLRLENAIKDRLLVLAQNWIWGAPQQNRWISSAYPFLQKEVYGAVHWLCMLTGNTLDHYFGLWRYPYWGQQQWAELLTVIPFEYYGNRDKFLQLVPTYLQPFNVRLSERHRLEGERLAAVVDTVRARNRLFNSFMGAFKKLHHELAHKPERTGGIDFRERQPLDYYLLLAIRAETCFRCELRRIGELDSIPKKDQGMVAYLQKLGTRSGLDDESLTFFSQSVKNSEKLYAEPQRAINQIIELGGSAAPQQLALVQAMVCCYVARNYFAHHDYLDDILLTNRDSGFLLGGILVGVLVLLGMPQE